MSDSSAPPTPPAAGAPPGWTALAPGVWSRAFGSPDPADADLLTSAPPAAGLSAMGWAPFPLPADRIAAELGPRRAVVRLPLGRDEAVFGFGLQFFRLNHRGRVRYLRVNSDPRQDTGESHAPVPLYVSSAGYLVLFRTARIVTVHCAATGYRGERQATTDRTTDPGWQATPAGDWVEAAVGGAGLEVLVFAGPTVLDAIRRYNLFSGGGVLPPRWGLGFWHRTPSRATAAEVEAEAGQFRERGFPCDVIGLEPGWHSTAYPCSFEWSPERFPDPAGFVDHLAAMGMRVNLWEHAWVSPQAPIHPALEPLSGSHTVWGGLAPDLTLPAARAVVEEQHGRAHLDAGISGYKLDECDGSELTSSSWMFPGHATFPSGRDGEEMRQVYGLLLQRLTAGLFAARDRRTYGLVRASGPGAASLPSVLYTDLYDHRQYVRALCNAGFSGLLFGPEVRSARTGEEWVRRMQVACFSPLAMLNAWSSGTKPWSFPEVEGIVAGILRLRMRLMPYLYSAFARYHQDGTPPFRALATEPAAADDPRLRAVDDAYLVGEDLLVAPLFAGETERQVLLPPGDWYGFETGRRWAGGGEPVTVRAALDEIPVFVRDGAIVPLGPALDHAPLPGQRIALEIRHYGRGPGRFRLYDDDGESLGHARGLQRWLEIRVAIGPDGPHGAIDPAAATPAFDGRSLAYDPVTWRFMAEAAD